MGDLIIFSEFRSRYKGKSIDEICDDLTHTEPDVLKKFKSNINIKNMSHDQVVNYLVDRPDYTAFRELINRRSQFDSDYTCETLYQELSDKGSSKINLFLLMHSAYIEQELDCFNSMEDIYTASIDVKVAAMRSLRNNCNNLI